jgi:tetratricopeptide (TPR) repeat protein
MTSLARTLAAAALALGVLTLVAPAASAFSEAGVGAIPIQGAPQLQPREPFFPYVAPRPPEGQSRETPRREGRGEARPAQARPAPPAGEEAGRRPVLEELFDRLAKARDEEEANGVAGAIERVFMRSGSDTADLLMSRARAAMQRKEHKVATELLDKVVIVEPDWAEAWAQRATVRYLDGDSGGAVADLGEALAREPRHFGALTGLGSILYQRGFERRAYEVFRRALAIYPHQGEVKKMLEKLSVEYEGRDI